MKDFRNRSELCALIACLAVFVLCCGSIELLASTLAVPPSRQPNPDVSKGLQLLGEGKLQEADALFQKAIEGDPGQLHAALARAQIALTQHQLDKADQMVSSVLKNEDTLPEAHNMKGVVLMLRKNNEGARHEFMRAIELQPLYVTPRLYLAAISLTSGNYSRAADDYKSLIKVAPKMPTGYLGEAESLTMMHREADALGVLEAWKAADPNTLTPYRVLASVYISDHKPQEAIHQLQAALAKAPKDSASLADLGAAYASSGDIRSATAQYQAALAANGANTEAALGLGILEAGSGQTDPALAHFRTVLQADPNNAVACNDIAWILAEQGKDLDEALRLSERAVKLRPKYADAYDTLGWVHYHRGEYVPAVTALKQAKALAPTSTDVAAHLGLAYAKTGQKHEALSELHRALDSGSKISNRPELEQLAAQLSAQSPGVVR